MEPTTSRPPGRGHSGGRVAAFVAAIVLGLISVSLLFGGSGLLWADGQKDEHGYISTDRERFATSGHAIATDNLDIDLDGLGDVVGDDNLGKLRLEVAPRGDEPLFVGVARTSDVDAYLHDSAHAVLTDVDFDPFRADYRDRPGAATPATPSGQTFWAASAQGAGTQALTWDVADGDWSVVVMNADGSAGVHAGVSAGASLGFLDDIAWALVGAGLLAALAAAGLLFAGARPRQRRPDEPNPSAPRSVVPSASTT